MQASINGIKIAFDDHGKGPAIIMIHGFPFNRNMWAPQISSLTGSGFRVIAPDLRGFGDTPTGGKPFDTGVLADDIAQLMKHLGIGRAVMVGMSTGGEVISELRKRYSRKVVATCILAPVVPPADSEEQSRYLSLAELVRGGQRRAAIEGLCKWYFPGEISASRQQLVGELRQLMETVDPQTFAAGLTFCAAPNKWAGECEAPNIPALVVTGEKDPISPPKRYRVLAKRFAAEPRQIVSAGGHMFNIEATGHLNQHLLKFLREVNLCKAGCFRLTANRIKSGFPFRFLGTFDEQPEVDCQGPAHA